METAGRKKASELSPLSARTSSVRNEDRTFIVMCAFFLFSSAIENEKDRRFGKKSLFLAGFLRLRSPPFPPPKNRRILGGAEHPKIKGELEYACTSSVSTETASLRRDHFLRSWPGTHSYLLLFDLID
jgi:hypothetical protein